MGHLENGKWITDQLPRTSAEGRFLRPASVFRNWITEQGSQGPSGIGGYKAESGRYHLYVSLACPWAHRTLILRVLKRLEEHISVDIVHPDMLGDGWTFKSDGVAAKGDSLYDSEFLRDIYVRSEPRANGRATVPVLWDRETETIVSNESSEIIRMFNTAFNGITGDNLDLWPVENRGQIEEFNERIYRTVNNGVYKAGFATSQAAYEEAANGLFDSFDWLERTLSNSRYLVNDELTEADWRLFTTLVRFDKVYATHFKCNRSRLVDYPNLWAYARELYQVPGVSETVNFHHIVRHYYFSHANLNPTRIIPIGPVADWNEFHGR
ncbi:MAG: glutathione S-transferase family protein [Albidovulum sp.]|nr:glutathione S-transferase family protein [Albidovulum sp.]